VEEVWFESRNGEMGLCVEWCFAEDGPIGSCAKDCWFVYKCPSIVPPIVEGVWEKGCDFWSERLLLKFFSRRWEEIVAGVEVWPDFEGKSCS